MQLVYASLVCVPLYFCLFLRWASVHCFKVIQRFQGAELGGLARTSMDRSPLRTVE